MLLPIPIQYRPRSFPYILAIPCFLFFFQKSFSQKITTVAGTGRNGAWSNGGPALQASVPYPVGVCTDAAGNLYITTSETVRKVAATSGIITPFAGSGAYGYSGDGGTATEASMKSPVAVCTDLKGNFFIAEYNGHRVRKVLPSGVITTVAGTGTAGYNGDGGPATTAQLSSPRSLATDVAGNLYIADFHNNRIRRVDAGTGIITTVAGTGISMSNGDGGTAPTACITAPSAVCVDKDGNVFFTEANLNLSCRVRKIEAGSGVISTVAGNGAAGFSGDGGAAVQARLFLPTGLAVDEKNNLFIAEHNGFRIRKADAATGVITTITGNGTPGFCCDGAPAVNALISNPLGLAIDTAGYLYVADNNNHRIRRIETRFSCTAPPLTITTPSALFCYNAAPQFTVSLSGTLTNPVYQWKINGVAYGGNEASVSLPAGIGDVISCEITGTNACGETTRTESNRINILSNPGYNQGPEVTIHADKQIICAGTNVNFTATNVSESANPVFQWLVNGSPAGGNSPVFSTTSLADGDKVECIMTVPHCGSNGGTTKDYSNAITIKVDAVPMIQFSPANVITEPGGQVQLRPDVQGTIMLNHWTPPLLLVDPALLSPTTKPLNNTTTFQLRVQTAAGCEATASVTVTVYSGLFIPNAFTPNSNGKNNVFRIPPTAAFALKDFTVFDRWGTVVFSTNDLSKGWDGKKGGINASADTYVYTIRGEDNKGPVFLKGTVQLIR